MKIMKEGVIVALVCLWRQSGSKVSGVGQGPHQLLGFVHSPPPPFNKERLNVS